MSKKLIIIIVGLSGAVLLILVGVFFIINGLNNSNEDNDIVTENEQSINNEQNDTNDKAEIDGVEEQNTDSEDSGIFDESETPIVPTGEVDGGVGSNGDIPGDSMESRDIQVTNPDITKNDGEFTLEAEYNDASGMWTYQITGNLPTPCYEAEVEELVMESFPEQVQINLKLNQPEADTYCIQVIQEYSYASTLAVDKAAELSFQVQQ